MKLTKTKTNKGMTLIELTVVILVLLSLISVLFIGARAWMRGSDRANAALLIRNAQQGVRSHTNIMGVETPSAGGTALDWGTASPDGSGLQTAIFGAGKFVENGQDAPAGTATPAESLAAAVPPTHPSSGNSFIAAGTDFEEVPVLGDLYMTSNTEAAFFEPEGMQ